MSSADRISMPLDGYVTAAGQTAEEPVGPGGEVLHDWAFGEDELGRKILEDGVPGLGTVVTGADHLRHVAALGGPNGPSGSARRPVFVVTLQAPQVRARRTVCTR